MEQRSVIVDINMNSGIYYPNKTNKYHMLCGNHSKVASKLFDHKVNFFSILKKISALIIDTSCIMTWDTNTGFTSNKIVKSQTS